MKSLLIHLMSKYAGARYIVRPSGNDIDVHDSQSGEHILAIRDGRDLSAELGCRDRLCMSPIPKSSRLFKEVAGKIVKDEKFAERQEARKQFLDEKGVVQSMESLKELGFDFDEKGLCVKAPQAAQVQA